VPSTADLCSALLGTPRLEHAPPDGQCGALLGPAVSPLEVAAAGPAELRAYHALRRAVFCGELGLFDERGSADLDGYDDAAVALVARHDGHIVGGVRLFEVSPGWWQGGRLVVSPAARTGLGVGSALIRAACAEAEARGALRFDATVLPGNTRLFERLGWAQVRPVVVAGVPHDLVRWPVGRIGRLAAGTKNALGALLAGMRPGGAGFVGDDAAPVPGSTPTMLASVDGILPSMVDSDPEWAGWCGVLVGANDLAAMGAVPSGLLDALGAPTAEHAARVLAGIRAGSLAFGLPVLGGHTQLGVDPALSVTVFGTARSPVPGAGRPGLDVTLTADLGGSWRPGYEGRQWDSSSRRTAAEIAAMTSMVGRTQPVAAKDVSMAGVVGTLGMLAEASGCGAELDVSAVPRPAGASVGDWLTCFPGFAMLTADEPGRSPAPAGPAVSTRCGRLTTEPGVRLRWPDGEVTTALAGPVTGLGPA
jgi:putative N-acetyltransferase (TIGR04045 family)